MSQLPSIHARRESTARLLLRLFYILITTHSYGMIGLGLVILLAGLLPAAELWIIGKLLDRLVEVTGLGREGFQALVPWALALVGTLVLGPLLDMVRGIVEVDAQERVRIRLQQQVIEKVQGTDLVNFEEPEFYDMLHRANEDMGNRILYLLQQVIQIAGSLIALGGILGVLFTGHWSLAPIVALGAIPGIWISKKVHRVIFWSHLTRTPQARKAQYLRELLLNRDEAKEVKLFALFDHLRGEWRDNARSLAAERRRLTAKKAWLDALSGLVRSWAYSLCLAILAYFLTGGALTIGQYGMLMQAVQQFARRLDTIVYAIGLSFEQCLYLGDLFEFLGMERRTNGRTPALEVARGRQPAKDLTLRLEDVSFQYPGTERPTLRDLSLEIRPGERIALVGENGAGKTTLIKLVMGLYQVSSGRILLGGRLLQEWDPEELRPLFAAVFQNFVKYQFSVRDNIAFGALEIEGEDRIRKAAEMAGAAEFIDKFPNQYHTLLGRPLGGVDLSIGQWQKLATARGLLRPSKFIILDEPTSALDPKAEAQVFRRFAEMTRDKTAILISHRLGSARIADRILVLKDGRLIEEGDHESLVAMEGEYARLFRLQARWYA